MTKNVIILGGEGNGGVVASCIRDMNERFDNREFIVEGFLNDEVEVDTEINGYPVMGKTSDVDKFAKQGFHFAYVIHPFGKGRIRYELFEKINIPLDRLVTIVHPSSVVAYNTNLAPGTLVMPNCHISNSTNIGVATFISPNSSIGHHCNIGKLCHFCTGSVTGSYINIGDASDIAINSTVVEKVNIGSFASLGAGSVLTRDIKDDEFFAGFPARKVK